MAQNNFNRLIKRLQRAKELNRYQDDLEKLLKVHGDRLVRQIAFNAPVGQDEPSYEGYGGEVTISHGRPSERLHGKHLIDAIPDHADVTKEPTGVKMTVSVDHPTEGLGTPGIFDWLSRGTKAHRIGLPESGLVSFWWGDPLRWPAKDGFEPGGRVFHHVNHPGIENPDPWLDNAWRNFKQEVEPEIIDRVSILWFSNFKGVSYLERTSGS